MRLRLNRSFILFVKASSTVRELGFYPGMARENPVEKRRQEFGVRQLIGKFFNDESGATAIEYCMIAAGLSIVIVTVVNGIGTNLSTKFVDVGTSLK